MLLSRTAAIVLRLSEFISAALVLGFSAWFLDQHHKYEVGPWGKEVYAITLASISVFLALLWLSTSTKRILNYPTDFILAAAWFAAFGTYIEDELQ
jgi:ABC-type transport system involved in cytochrome c biogenesis permease subunit